jgi:hypothetical protein
MLIELFGDINYQHGGINSCGGEEICPSCTCEKSDTKCKHANKPCYDSELGSAATTPAESPHSANQKCHCGEEGKKCRRGTDLVFQKVDCSVGCLLCLEAVS